MWGRRISIDDTHRRPKKPLDLSPRKFNEKSFDYPQTWQIGRYECHEWEENSLQDISKFTTAPPASGGPSVKISGSRYRLLQNKKQA